MADAVGRGRHPAGVGPPGWGLRALTVRGVLGLPETPFLMLALLQMSGLWLDLRGYLRVHPLLRVTYYDTHRSQIGLSRRENGTRHSVSRR
jgi:hypothetical protein